MDIQVCVFSSINEHHLRAVNDLILRNQNVLSINTLKTSGLKKVINKGGNFVFLVSNDDKIKSLYKDFGVSVDERIAIGENYKIILIRLNEQYYEDLKYFQTGSKYQFKLFGNIKQDIEKFLGTRCEYSIVANDEDIFVELYLDNHKFRDKIIKDFIKEFKKQIYAEGDFELASLVVKRLSLQKDMLSTAESFTGGGVARRITSVPGSSSVFYEGLVTYDSLAKIKRLMVKRKTIEEDKPVSYNTAYEMCHNLLINSKSNYGIATTGIAGPSSDDSKFPVGLCYIAVGSREKIKVFEFNFSGNRQQIMDKGVNTALFLLVKLLRKEI